MSALRAAAIIIGTAVSITLLGPFFWEHGWRALYAGQPVIDPQGISTWVLYSAWLVGGVCFIVAVLATFGTVRYARAKVTARRRRLRWLPR